MVLPAPCDPCVCFFVVMSFLPRMNVGCVCCLVSHMVTGKIHTSHLRVDETCSDS